MKIKQLTHWAEDVGLQTMPWINKDWESICQLLSKLLSDDLIQKKCTEVEDVKFKISFNALLQIAEDILGIPQLIVEEDLSAKYPNIHLALLTYMLCMKQSLNGIDSKVIRDSIAPNLVFEANSTAEQLPFCEACGLYAFLIERIIVDKKVWHRRCFVCFQCNKQLFRGSYRSIDNGKYECVEHFANNILSRLSSPKKKASGLDSDVNNPFADDDESFAKALATANAVKPRVPPPRPPPPKSNRVSEIIHKQMQEQLNIDVETKKTEPEKPIPLPRHLKKDSPTPKKEDISDYPGFLNPFGTDDESQTDDSDYDDTLNPFADDDEPSQPSPQLSIKSNGRPTSNPPPPPKPPRTSLLPASTTESTVQHEIVTLPRAKKTYRAPPPPIPIKRKIEFTENKSYESLEDIVAELKEIQQEHEKLELQGRGMEKELLFALGKEAMEWKKNKKVEEWISVVEQKCSTIRREAVLIRIWLERFLNDIHADTEYQLRCVLEGCENGKERTPEEINKETELLEVLVDIMSLKNGIIESGVDPNSLLDSQSPKDSKHNRSKMKMMKKRLKKLKKKL
uniref:LIM zinc-binding domain-containing protein n=1 Tax=Panagrolaimus sp. JU765 TaxID=591449 RepID=A0AC34RF89_9BILA